MVLLQYRFTIDEWQLGFILMHLTISSLASNVDISVVEINCFLAQIILMEHEVWDTIKAYWSINKLHCTRICSEVMKYDCFVHVMEVLHFESTQHSPDRVNPSYDRSWKNQEFLTM